METIKKRDVIQEADLSYTKKIGIEEGIELSREEGIGEELERASYK